MTDYLIFSTEHGMWWRMNRCGYTSRLSEAGRYTRQEALRVCAAAIPGTAERIGRLPELPVRAEDAQVMAESFEALYPDRREFWQ